MFPVVHFSSTQEAYEAASGGLYDDCEKRLGLAGAAALAISALGMTARADSVTFYTQGFFNTDTPNLTGPNINGDQLNSSSGLSHLTYHSHASAVLTLINGFSYADFGDFVLTSTSPTIDSFPLFSGNAPTFTLDLFQTAPSVFGPGAFLGAVQGQVLSTGSTLTVTFSKPFSVVAPGAPPILYTLVAPNMTINTLNTGDYIQGSVTELPLPSTASAGLVALGGLAAAGGLKKLRNRNAAVTV